MRTNHRTAIYARALKIRCPKCWADPGQPCTKAYMHKTQRPHVARIRQTTRSIEVEGNNGGSFIRIEETSEGMVHLEVGETCIRTIKQEISVSALACILTAAKDKGLQLVLDEYLASDGGRGCPKIKIESDVSVERRNAGR